VPNGVQLKTDTTTPGVSSSNPLVTHIILTTRSRLDLRHDGAECTCRALQPATVLARHGTRYWPTKWRSGHWCAYSRRPYSTTDEQYLYEGCELVQRFRKTTEKRPVTVQVARETESLGTTEGGVFWTATGGQCSSERFRQLSRKRTRRRHALEALCRALLERLDEGSVDSVSLGEKDARSACSGRCRPVDGGSRPRSLSGMYQRPSRPYVVRNGSGVARKTGSQADDAARGIERDDHAYLESTLHCLKD
jgi:hypothetical protein